MNPAYPNVPHGFPGSQAGSSLLQSNSFSVQPGQGTDGTRYTVKDQNGHPVLWVFDMSHGQPQTSLVVKDAGQLDVLRLSQAGTPAVQLQNPSGQPIGSVSVASKDIKAHKKEKHGNKDKKRLFVLNDPMNHPLLTMGGKGSKKDGRLEMSIKFAATGIKLPGSLGSMIPTDLLNLHKDKKDKKDKDKKDKDHKDKDKKNKKKEVGEVTGSLSSGLHLRFNQATAMSMPERVNVIGLLLSYMELKKLGPALKTAAPYAPYGQGYPAQPQHYPGSPAQPQYYPGQPQAYPGQLQHYPGQPAQPQHYPGQPAQPQHYPGQPAQPQHYPGQPAQPQPYYGQPQQYPGQPAQHYPTAPAGGSMGFVAQPQHGAPLPGQAQHYHPPNY